MFVQNAYVLEKLLELKYILKLRVILETTKQTWWSLSMWSRLIKNKLCPNDAPELSFVLHYRRQRNIFLKLRIALKVTVYDNIGISYRSAFVIHDANIKCRSTFAYIQAFCNKPIFHNALLSANYGT